MLTYHEKFKLAELVYANKSILFGKLRPGIDCKKCDEIWKNIHRELLALDAVVNDHKTLKRIDFDNLKKATMKKYVKSLITGSQSFTFTKAEEIILDIVGQDSIDIVALDVPDVAVSFGTQASSSKTPTQEVCGQAFDAHSIPLVFNDEANNIEAGRNKLLVFFYLFTIAGSWPIYVYNILVVIFGLIL